MTYELKAPKCKKKFDLQLLAKQLPIPIEILDENKKTYLEYYSAYLTSDDKIIVKDLLQAEHLYKYGCFGKAEFSRGFPSLNTNNFEKDEHEFDLTHSMKNIQLMSNERYNRRKDWSNFDKKELSADDNFHEIFLKEFLEDKTKLLNLNEFDLKPKCRVEINKKLSLFNEDNAEEECVKEKIKNDKKT